MKSKLCLLIFIFLAFFFSSSKAIEMESSKYKLCPLISWGGGVSQSNNYLLYAIIGQVVGNASSSNYNLELGLYDECLALMPPPVVQCIACSSSDSGTHCCSDDGLCAGGANSCDVYDCGANPSCNDKSPGEYLQSCDKGGETFFADKCDASCQAVDRDNICRAPGSLGPGDGCTADQLCDGVEAGTSYCDLNCHFNVGGFSFVAWLGVEKVNTTVGETVPINIYVKNIGIYEDSYKFEVSSPQANVKVKLHVEESPTVEPGGITSSEVDVTLLEATSATITITITSQTTSTLQRQLTLTIQGGEANMSEMNAFFLIQLLFSSVLIFLRLNKDIPNQG